MTTETEGLETVNPGTPRKKATKKKAKRKTKKKANGISEKALEAKINKVLDGKLDSFFGRFEKRMAERDGSSDARFNPVRSTRNDIDVDGGNIGELGEREMRSEGPALESLDAPQIETVESMPAAEKLEYERFMNDVLTVHVHDTSNENDDPLPCIINGGIRQFLIRGEEQEIRRKYIEVMARARVTTYTQKLVRDNEGNMSYRQVPHSVPRYPFSVIYDPAGRRGHDWLKAIMKNPG